MCKLLTVYRLDVILLFQVQATGPLFYVVREGYAHGNEYSVTFDGSDSGSFQLNTSQSMTQCACVCMCMRVCALVRVSVCVPI